MGYHTITQHEREKSDPTGVVGAEEEKREARKGRREGREERGRGPEAREDPVLAARERR